MSRPHAPPPTLSRRLLDWAAARLELPELGDDAAALYEERARRDGEPAARRWYRAQARAAAARVLLPGNRAPRLPSPRAAASWLDVKLGLRMLSRHPGLTVVAIFALAIGIPVGLLPLHVLASLGQPLPVQDAHEIVTVRNYDRAASEPVSRPLHDYVQWRGELRSFESLGLWRRERLNVGPVDGPPHPVQGAEVTASLFAMLRVPPLMGRPLDAADEAIGAPDVAVIGHDVWQSRFAGDPRILGRTIRVGGVPHTVVGVMPQGFLFPVHDQLWVPFRADPLQHAYGEGPSGSIIGRLADGVTMEEAQRELDVIGRRLAAEQPATHERLRPQVVSYTRTLTGIDGPEMALGVALAQLLSLLLLVLACGNVGVLILARTATRATEIAVRTALGASRGRILTQLFVESLLLAVLGAGAGLLLLQAAATGPDYLLAGLPFWVDFEVSLRTALLAVGLAVLSAVIAGVVPALKATGRNLRTTMQAATAGGGGVRFGRGYSALIVGEVAAALVLLSIGAAVVPAALSEPGGVGIPAAQYLHASVQLPRVAATGDAPAGALAPPAQAAQSARAAAMHRELARRLGEEPGLGPVAIASALPGTSHPTRYVQVEGAPRPADAPAPAWTVSVARVDPGFFEALGQPILDGRGFGAGDLGTDRSAVVVNTRFVERVLGGRNPIGRRLRYWSPEQEPGPWAHEIVGVVGPLGMNALNADLDQGVYHAAAPGELHPLHFAVRVGPDPLRFAPRLREIVAGIDAGALTDAPMPLDQVPDPNRQIMELGSWLLLLLAGIAVVLAAACLYALMSFTVAERTRESAIRAALGARPARIVTTIARRAFVQLALGVTIGAALSAGVLSLLGSTEGSALRTTNWPVSVSLLALLMVAVGLLACLRPTLRLVRIQPLEALKS